MQSIAISGLGDKIIQYPDIVNAIKPLLSDQSWQVRGMTVETLGRLKQPAIDNLLTPALKDDSVFVRRSAISNLGVRVHENPELLNPLVDVVKQDSDSWNRMVAALSLDPVQGPQVEPIKPLIQQNLPASEVKVVVIIHGIDHLFNFQGVTYKRNQLEDWSKDTLLRESFESKGVKVMEHRWPASYKNIPGARVSLDHTITAALDFAGPEGKVLTIMYSAGNLVGERFFSPSLDPTIKYAFEEDRLDLISLQSPSIRNFAQLDLDWKNFGSFTDPISWPSITQSLNTSGVRYNYFPDIVSNPFEVHEAYKDPRVISDIINQAFPSSRLIQPDIAIQPNYLTQRAMLTPSMSDTWQQKYIMGETSFQYHNESLMPQIPIEIMPSYQQQLWLQQSLQPSYIPDISTDYSFRDITLRMQPPTLMEKMFTQQQMLGIGPMYNPSFNMPTIEDYSFKDIRLIQPPVYNPPPVIMYEPPVYIPPPVIINP